MKFKLYILGVLLCYFSTAKAQKVDSIKLRLDIFGVNAAASTVSDDAVPVNITTYDKVSWGDGFGVANRAFIQALRNVVLPTTLQSFNAKKDGDAVKVNWATAMEKNASHFEILRSVDGKKFDRITSVGAKGNSNDLLNYSYRDTKPLNGTNYYQLKSIDRDGTFTTSIIIAVQFDLNKTDVTIIANAENQSIKVNVYSPVDKVANFSVADINGKILLNAKNIALQKGNNVLKYALNAPNQLLIGVMATAKEKTAYKFYY